MGEPTIHDVAKRAGVSVATVSRALNGLDRVAPKTRLRVEQASRELNFSASKTATLLRTGRTNRIALVVGNELAGWYSSELTEGIYSRLSQTGYDLVTYRVADMGQRQAFFSSMPLKRNVDAAITSSFALSPTEAEALNEVDIPIVTVNAANPVGRVEGADGRLTEAAPDYSQASIGIDDLAAMSNTVQQLAEMGHRRIAYVENPIDNNFEWNTNRRIEGYREGLRRAGLPEQPDYEITVGNSRLYCQEALGAILSLSPKPTAVCCMSDEIAIPLVSMLEKFGLRVPEDISVTGFDDWTICEPLGLSTVHHEPRAYGFKAAQMAIDLIDGKTLHEPHRHAPARLILRDSVAPLS